MTEKVNPSPIRPAEAFKTALGMSYGGHGAGPISGYVVPGGDPTDIAVQDTGITEGNLNTFSQSSSTSSLDVTIDPGEAFVAGSWLAIDSSTTISLAASTNSQTVYVGWDKEAANDVIVGLDAAFDTAAGNTDERIPLYDFDTDGSGVTSVTDRRRTDYTIDVPGAAYFGSNEDVKVEWDGSALDINNSVNVPADTFDSGEVDIGLGLEDDGSGSIRVDEDTDFTFTSAIDFSSGLDTQGDITDGTQTIWDVSAQEIPDSAMGSISNSTLTNSSITVNSNDGLKNGGSVSLGGTIGLDIEPADFAGSFLTDDGSDNLQVDIGRGLEDDGSGNIRFDEDTQYTFTGLQTFNGGISAGGDIDLNDNNQVTNAPAPTQSTDLARKEYVDSVAQGLNLKESTRAASTGNVDLTSTTDPNPIDGVTLNDGDRVLLKDQTTATENGIYVATTATDPSTWTRSDDANEDSEVTSGMFTFSEEGTNNGNTSWIITTNDPITLGTTAINFAQFASAGEISAGDGLSKSGLTLSVDVSDFAGSFLSDDGSENLAVDIGSGLTDDGSGNIAHADTSTQANIAPSGATVINDVNLDDSGHVTSLGTSNRTLDDWGNASAAINIGNNAINAVGEIQFDNIESVTASIGTLGYDDSEGLLLHDGEGHRVIADGDNLSGGTDISVSGGTSSGGSPITISHADTTTQGDVTTGGSTVIDDLYIDGRGHVTNINTQNRSLDDWNAANSNLNIGHNDLYNVNELRDGGTVVRIDDGSDSVEFEDTSGNRTTEVLGQDFYVGEVSTWAADHISNDNGHNTLEHISGTLTTHKLNNGEYVSLVKLNVPSGKSTLDVYASGCSNSNFNSPGGLVLRVYNHTENTIEYNDGTTYSDGDPLTSIGGLSGDNISVVVDNGNFGSGTGGTQIANGHFSAVLR